MAYRSEWSEERLRELAEAEDGCGGVMACSPEIYGKMMVEERRRQIFVVMIDQAKRNGDTLQIKQLLTQYYQGGLVVIVPAHVVEVLRNELG